MSLDLPELDSSAAAFRITPLVAGCPLSGFTVLNPGRLIKPLELRALITQQSGFDLCVKAVSEALIDCSLATPPQNLRKRLAARALQKRRAD